MGGKAQRLSVKLAAKRGIDDGKGIGQIHLLRCRRQVEDAKDRPFPIAARKAKDRPGKIKKPGPPLPQRRFCAAKGQHRSVMFQH